MWVRLIGAPCWVRWLVTALFLVLILPVLFFDVAHSTGWAWGLVVLGIYSLVFAAVAQDRQPLPRCPAPPLRAPLVGHRQGAHAVPWGLLAAVGFVTSRHLRCHLERLRAAAASANAEDSIALPGQRRWLSALVAIIAGIATVPLVVGSTPTPTPTPKHRTANADITFTAGQPKILDALITPGDPGLSRYDAEKWLPSISAAMYDANIITPDQQAAFLAQIAEESGGLQMVNELPWGLDRSQWNDKQAMRDYFDNKYANMNGNGDVSSGDGYNYRGRGILQITGKSNYAVVSEMLYGDDRLVKNPDLLSQPDVACAAAAAYWIENDLNRFIPPGQPVTPQEFQDLGSTINTGHPGDVPNNADERVKYWALAKEAFGIK